MKLMDHNDRPDATPAYLYTREASTNLYQEDTQNYLARRSTIPDLRTESYAIRAALAKRSGNVLTKGVDSRRRRSLYSQSKTRRQIAVGNPSKKMYERGNPASTPNTQQAQPHELSKAEKKAKEKEAKEEKKAAKKKAKEEAKTEKAAKKEAKEVADGAKLVNDDLKLEQKAQKKASDKALKKLGSIEAKADKKTASTSQRGNKDSAKAEAKLAKDEAALSALSSKTPKSAKDEKKTEKKKADLAKAIAKDHTRYEAVKTWVTKQLAGIETGAAKETTGTRAWLSKAIKQAHDAQFDSNGKAKEHPSALQKFKNVMKKIGEVFSYIGTGLLDLIPGVGETVGVAMTAARVAATVAKAGIKAGIKAAAKAAARKAATKALGKVVKGEYDAHKDKDADPNAQQDAATSADRVAAAHKESAAQKEQNQQGADAILAQFDKSAVAEKLRVDQTVKAVTVQRRGVPRRHLVPRNPFEDELRRLIVG